MIQEPTDAIVKITSTAICGSDLHRCEVLGSRIRADPTAGNVFEPQPSGEATHGEWGGSWSGRLLTAGEGSGVSSRCSGRSQHSHRGLNERGSDMTPDPTEAAGLRVLVQIEEAGDDACDVSIVEDAVKGPGVLAPPAVRQPLIAVRNREALTRLALIAEGRRRQGLSAP